MDFELTEEQKIIRESAREFLINECPKELVRELDESDEGYSPELWKKMAELGWMGLVIPEEYGGSGASFIDLMVLLEEMGYNICPGPFLSTVILGSLPILEAGSEQQKRAFLPRIAQGELKATMALTEPRATYEASAIKTSARPDGNEYVISGTKLFVPDAHIADYIICVARTDDSSAGNDLTSPEKDIALFLVECSAPGVKTTLLKTLSREKQCEVLFEDVRVSKDALLEKRGWQVVQDILDRASLALGAEMLGGAKAVLDMTLQYAHDRTQFNRPIGSFQAVQQHLANMWADAYGTQYLIYKSACNIAAGNPAPCEVAMAKARIGQAYRRVTILGHQIFGGIGFTMEHDMHLYHRRSITGDLLYGDSDFQHERIARELGL
jgi:alkylation response protein AidB-like acyl-CoA dehydrogenase